MEEEGDPSVNPYIYQQQPQQQQQVQQQQQQQQQQQPQLQLVSQDLNTRSSSENTKRALVLFPDDNKPSGLVRPFRAVSSQPSNKNQATFKVKPGFAKPQEEQPNYRTVIGASYDDLPASKTVEDDFEDPEEATTESDKKSGYSKQELYDLCIKEVPNYLRNDLCGSLLESQPNRRIDVIPTQTTSQIKTTTSQRSTSPVTTTEKIQIVVATEQSSTQASVQNNYLGIPLELPIEIKRKGQQALDVTPTNQSTTYQVYRTSDSPLRANINHEEVDPVTSLPVTFESSETVEPEQYPETQALRQPVASPPQRPLPQLASNARPEARNPTGYFSRLINFFGGSKPNPNPSLQQQQQQQQQRLFRRRINA